MNRVLTALAAAALFLLPSAGAKAQMSHDGHSPMGGGQAGQSADASPSAREFQSADRRMMEAMQVPYTGDADVDFRTHMIPHHQGAIDMARVALKYAKDEETRRMAQKVIDDQEREIAEMKAWLQKRGR